MRSGECACVSVHGAQSPGNQFTAGHLVFGRAGGQADHRGSEKEPASQAIAADAADKALARLARLDGQKNGESVAEVGDAMRKTMQAHCGVFRFAKMLEEGVVKIG